MIGYIDVADTSASDPGQSGSLSPYCDMKSLYFDDSLYENEMHYKIAQYIDESPLNTLEEEDEKDWEEIRIVADNATEYNKILDKLYHYGDGKLKMYGTSNNPMEIIIEKDPRENYRKFDENLLMGNEEENK